MPGCTCQSLLPNSLTTVFYYIWIQSHRKVFSWSPLHVFPVRFVSWVSWRREKRASKTWKTIGWKQSLAMGLVCWHMQLECSYLQTSEIELVVSYEPKAIFDYVFFKREGILWLFFVWGTVKCKHSITSLVWQVYLLHWDAWTAKTSIYQNK